MALEKPISQKNQRALCHFDEVKNENRLKLREPYNHIAEVENEYHLKTAAENLENEISKINQLKITHKRLMTIKTTNRNHARIPQRVKLAQPITWLPSPHHDRTPNCIAPQQKPF